MEGNFISKKVKSRNSSFVDLNIQFQSEAEFVDVLQYWINGVYRVHLISHTWYKPKTCSFMVDEHLFFFSLPPFQQNPFSENATQGQTDIVISKYLEKNKGVLQKQYMELIGAVRNRNSDLGTVPYCKDIFNDSQIRIINSKLETVFTDQQVINLCKKLSTPFIRRLLLNPVLNLTELHFLAMKCYQKYGSHLISFILSLPEMQFGNNSGKPFIKKELYDGSISSFILKFKNQTDEFLFIFYSTAQTNKKSNTIATVFNRSKHRVEGTISKKGYFESRLNHESLSGRIFVQNWESNNPIVYCGVKTGFCINCGRELNDPRSLQAGYGKECANELGIPYFN